MILARGIMKEVDIRTPDCDITVVLTEPLYTVVLEKTTFKFGFYCKIPHLVSCVEAP